MLLEIGVNMLNKIEWRTKQVKLGDLKEFDINPRKISDTNFKKLVDSLSQDGYHTRIKANHENRVIGGHQRLKAMLQAGWSLDDEIEILQPTKKLTDKEFRRVNVRDNLEFGKWDWDVLQGSWDFEELGDFGFDFTDTDLQKDLLKNEIEGSEQGVESVFDIIIKCQNETEQQKLYDELSNRGIECKVVSI